MVILSLQKRMQWNASRWWRKGFKCSSGVNHKTISGFRPYSMMWVCCTNNLRCSEHVKIPDGHKATLLTKECNYRYSRLILIIWSNYFFNRFWYHHFDMSYWIKGYFVYFSYIDIIEQFFLKNYEVRPKSIKTLYCIRWKS